MKSFHSVQKSTEKPSRYRSVKYKVAREASLSSCFESVEKKPKHTNFPSTTKYTYSRNRRNISEFNNRNTTEAHRNNPSLNEESFSDISMRKTSYMESFDFLVKMEKNRYNKREKK